MLLNTVGAEHMFEIEATSNSTSQNLFYDYNSVMHFQPYEYAASEGEPTFLQLLPAITEELLGNFDIASASDFLHIYLLYCKGMSNSLSSIFAHTYYNINANIGVHRKSINLICAATQQSNVSMYMYICALNKKRATSLSAFCGIQTSRLFVLICNSMDISELSLG